MKAIEEAGGKPFFDYQVPAAVLTLKQGFGRLIRSLEDRGVLVLLDPRITRQRYGQTFLQSLPPYRMTQTITDVEEFFSKAPQHRIESLRNKSSTGFADPREMKLCPIHRTFFVR